MRTINKLVLILTLVGCALSAHAQYVQQGGKLVGSGAVGAAGQGPVSISADGSTVAIGGPDDNGGIGAIWIFTRTAGVWTQQGAKLVGTGNVGASRQGGAVALSVDGNTVVVGGPGDANSTGATWMFIRTNGAWTQQGGKLAGSDAVGVARQGTTVAIAADGATAIVGGNSDNGGDGAAWIYVRGNGIWSQQGNKLTGAGSALTAFGTSVSLSTDGNTSLIGGPADGGNAGAMWVFTRTAGVWSQQAKVAGTGKSGNSAEGSSASLSADGNTALCGGSGDNGGIGAAWVYVRAGAAWSQQGPKLIGSNPTGTSAQGVSAALSGDGNTAVLGGNTDAGGVGAAWTFVRVAGAWTQQGAKLTGTGTAGNTGQGVSVATTLEGSTAVIGGSLDNANSGAAWVFTTATHLSLSAPAAVSGGSSFSLTISARDVSNNIASGYAGTIALTSSDGAALLPANYTFLPADNGTHMLNVTLNTTGIQTITATDTLQPTITGTSNSLSVNVTVSPAALPSATLNQTGYSQKVVAAGGTGTLTLSHSGAIPTGMTFTDATGILNGTPTALGTYSFTVTATDSVGMSGSTTYMVPVISVAPGTFTTVAPMVTAREQHTSTLLTNGKVLVAGGVNNGVYVPAAELYDPKINTWSSAGNLQTARQYHTATLLQNGKVAIIGGLSPTTLTSVELYDPVTNSWSTGSSFAFKRYGHTATLLRNGKVLITGGYYIAGAINSCELYDPQTDTWSMVGALAQPRYYHTATLLADGEVLAVGGYRDSNFTVNSTAEIYNPATNSWTSAASPSTPRGQHAATLLPSGKVFVVGGFGASGITGKGEVYDARMNTWAPAATTIGLTEQMTATLLPNGKVLVAGGYSNHTLQNVSLYNPGTNSFENAGQLIAARGQHTATLLPDGKVLMVAGYGASSSDINSAELYNSTVSAWAPASNLSVARSFQGTTLMPDGTVLVTGGQSNSGAQTGAELYNPVTNVWTQFAPLSAARGAHSQSLLPGGKVLVAGGLNNLTVLSGAELYDPAMNAWTPAGSLMTARAYFTATVLSSGKVLVAGGMDQNGAYLNSAELYDPATNMWTQAGTLSATRDAHSATLLPNGKVLVVGGYNGNALASVELYDSTTNSWSTVASLNTARNSHTASLLPSGKILVAGGGQGNAGFLNSAEIYDPANNTWSSAGALATTRRNHTATLLSNGTVLVTGGFNGTSLQSAERYNPATNTWTSAGTLAVPRRNHTASMLPSGKVLVIAGDNNSLYLSTAELGDDGLQYQSAWRPTITSATSPLQVQTPMSLTGTLFTGISEASGGATNNSPSNFPFVVLQSLANEQVRYLRPDPATPWNSNTYKSLNVSPLNPGYALLTVIVNGIPSQSSIVQINNPSGVTPVTIAKFTARPEGAGVLLSWNCVSEFKNAGFNLYRRAAQEPRPQGSGWTRVNPALIPGRITNPDPKQYLACDWPAPGVYEYKLESVSLADVTESYRDIAGPVVIDSTLTPKPLNPEGIDGAFATTDSIANTKRYSTLSSLFAPSASQNQDSQHSAQSTSNVRQLMPAAVRAIEPARSNDFQAAVAARWFTSSSPIRATSFTAAKVIYRTPGVLLIPQSTLPAGFNIDRLWITREGRALAPLTVTDDALLVYAPGYQDDYTDKDALFLRSSNAPLTSTQIPRAHGLFSAAQIAAVDSTASVTTNFHDVYFDFSQRPYTFPPWFSSQYLSSGTAQTFTIGTANTVAGPASLTLTLWSLTQNDSVAADHALQVVFNGQPAGFASWSGGNKMMQLTFQLAPGMLLNGTNQLDLITPTLDGVSSQMSFLHSITVSYARALDGSKPLDIYNASQQSKLYEVARVPGPDAWVVDARYPDRAALAAYESQAQADGTYTLRFNAPAGGTGHFLVVPAGQENLPIAVTKRKIAPAKSAAYLATGPSQFSAAVQPLLAPRSKEGLRGVFIDQEQLFDYYNFGRYGPSAIQNTVRAIRPQYLLLLGRTTYDYRNYSGLNVDPLCPAFLVSTTFWSQATSDSQFGDLGRGFPEVAVGRLPVNNASELSIAVQHVLSNKPLASGFAVHAVADRADPDVADFAVQTNAIAQSHPDLSWQQNYLGVTCQTAPEVTAAMQNAVNGGADLLLYVGHGNAVHLGKDAPRILDTDSVQAWAGNVVFLQSTCTANWMAKNETGYRSIAIQALTQPQGGISASIASSTYMNSDNATAFMNQLLSNANRTGIRWGDALLRTQQWAHARGSAFYLDLSATEQIFGDPAMPVFAPPGNDGSSKASSLPGQF